MRLGRLSRQVIHQLVYGPFAFALVGLVEEHL